MPPNGDDFERALLQRMTEDSRRQMQSLAPIDENSLREYRDIAGSSAGAMKTMLGCGVPSTREFA